MVKCSFSGEEIEPGTGVMYVKKDGKIMYFKNSKCMKNALKLKKKFLETRWSKKYKGFQDKKTPKNNQENYQND